MGRDEFELLIRDLHDRLGRMEKQITDIAGNQKCGAHTEAIETLKARYAFLETKLWKLLAGGASGGGVVVLLFELGKFFWNNGLKG